MLKTPYPQIDTLVIELRDGLTIVLGKKLLALYLFGSLVGGDFDPHTSDIDLLAITHDDITSEDLAVLRKVHANFAAKYPDWNDRIEVAYVGVVAMRKFKTDTATIARISPGEPLHYRTMDVRWLMDWYMVQEQGVVLLGPKPQAFIPTISSGEFVQSLKNEYAAWSERAKEARRIGYQSYIILSLCRGLYAIRNGKQISKMQGGVWAMQKYPQWAHLIECAMKWHGSPDKSDSLDTQTKTMEFAEFMVGQL